MKKSLSFVLVVVMLTSVVTAFYASDGDIVREYDEAAAEALFEEMIPEDVRRAAEAQQPALDSYQKIMDEFGMDEFGRQYICNYRRKRDDRKD